MSFGQPIIAYLAAATPLVLALVFAIDFTRRRRALDAIGNPETLQRMLAHLSVRRRVTKAILYVVALTGLVTAMARPQVEGESSWRQRGIDVAVVLDFSKSMLAEDVYPSRFERSLIEIDALVGELEASRLAVVAVAGNAEYFPLSHDGEAIRSFLAGLGPGDMAPGSDLGRGVALARCVVAPELADPSECESLGRRAGGGAPLEADPVLSSPARAVPREEDRARVVVLFTDGEDTGGRLVAEIERAAEMGMHVFVVGVGTAAGELVPRVNSSGEKVGWMKKPGLDTFVTTRLDRDSIAAALSAAGALGQGYELGRKSFPRSDLVAKLQSLKKGNLDERVVKQPVEVYHWFLFPALLLLILEACIRERRRLI